VNYCDEELPATSWPSLYYGANLQRLRQVKTTYDPLDVFAGPQSIRAAG
jgi:FAD/FMN-containing dehydrogenase